MHLVKSRRWSALGAVTLLMLALLAVFGTSASEAEAGGKSINFKMVPSSPAIKSCLPRASADITVKSERNNQKMTIRVKYLAPNTNYDFFVLQVPHAKFGLAWYQSEIHTDDEGEGEATVRGIFSNETFSVSLDTVTTNGREGTPQTGAKFNAVNQYHLGLWFDDPEVPFKLGCEPGATVPVVTPFNGDQHAGIQVLNTSNFTDNAGPLKQLVP